MAIIALENTVATSRAGMPRSPDGFTTSSTVSRDWSATSFGPEPAWSPALRAAVGLVLAARPPMVLFWGDARHALSNDAARMLKPGDENLAWSSLEAAVVPVMRGAAGQPVTFEAGARRWEASLSPVPDESAPDGVGGVLAMFAPAPAAALSPGIRFRELADAAPVMMWLADGEQRYTWCNEPWLRFTGRGLEQEIGSGWFDGVHPEDAERCRQTYADAVAQRARFRLDFRLRRHDGEWRVMDNTGAPWLADDGALRGFVGSCIDVTRQRETEARFRGVFNAELMGMSIYDAHSGETLAINDCFLRMTGHDRADFDEGNWTRSRRILPAQAPAVEAALAQARERGWWDMFEKDLSRKDGSIFPARVSSAPLPGQPGRVLVAVQDITAEREAQAALVASEERFRLGLEAGRMATWEFVFATGQLTCSSNVEAIFGAGSQPADFAARMPIEDIEADRLRLERAFADPDGRYDSEFRYVHPDGRLLHLHNWGLVMRDAAGAPSRIFGVCLDVSERKRTETALKLLNETLELQVQRRTEELLKAEEALRQSQKVEALGHLTGGVAHDFNNLLGAMVGSFDLIRRRSGDPERVRALAEAGLRAAERGAKLTSQLLTFSRSQRIELRQVVISEVIDGIGDLLRRTAGPLITVSLEVDSAGHAVLSDATQLEMALLNMAINARDAMQGGGNLIIGARLRQIDRDPELAPGQYVDLRVSDTGTGMSAETAARAFDPFFTTKGIGKGTGLGLSQVYGIARQAGGIARIESSEGQGTTICLLLPCIEMTRQSPAPARPPPALLAATDALLLVVDDDDDLREVLAALLNDLGYRVLSAADGAAGLRLLEQHAPDLLIADFAMPGMTGADLAKAARRLRPSLPIVFASGYADTQAIDEAAGAATPVLRKPFRIEELQAALAQALMPRH